MSSVMEQSSVRFTTVDGEQVTWTIEPGTESGPAHGARGGFRSRPLTVVDTGRVMLQRRLVDRPTGDRAARELRLDGEISAGLRLVRRYEPDDYPRILPKIIGYAVDVEEPFVLWEPQIGRPLRELAGQLLSADIDRVVTDLFSGLTCLADTNIVHRGISPDTVRWTGTHALIDGLALAAMEGEPRAAVGTVPWAAPEQRSGTGSVDRRDDVWSAAALIAQLISGQQLSAAKPPRAELLGPRYGQLLADALAPRAAMRPGAAEVLTRLRIAPPRNVTRPSGGQLAAGARQFDEVLAGKTARTTAAGATVPVTTGAEAKPPRRWWWQSAPPPPPRPRPSPYPARRCYLCLDPVEWQPTDLFLWDGTDYRELPIGGITDPGKLEESIRHAFRRCPNPTGDTPPHYLPVQYLRSGRPINIGVIGQSGVGKTHLLAGIIREIENEGLRPFDINSGALDIAWHDAFRQSRVVRLYEAGEMLPHTAPADVADFADGLVLSVGSTLTPVMFFDVSGEVLRPGSHQQRPRATRFLAAVDALLFVVNADPEPGAESDTTFSAVLDRLSYRQGPHGLLEVPSAVVITQCDRLRFEEPIDRWIRLRQPDRDQIDRDRVLAESRDAYAYLYSRRRLQLLTPFSQARQCTLHFVSATGADDDKGVFRFGARPQRCLDPLLALLVMTGVLPDWTRRSGEEPS